MQRFLIAAAMVLLLVLGWGTYYLATAGEYERLPNLIAPSVDYHAEHLGAPSEPIAVYEYYGSADPEQRPDFDVHFDGEVVPVE